MAENSVNFMETINLEIKDVQQIPGRINTTEKIALRYIIDCLNIKRKPRKPSERKKDILTREQCQEWMFACHQKHWGPEDNGSSINCWKDVSILSDCFRNHLLTPPPLSLFLLLGLEGTGNVYACLCVFSSMKLCHRRGYFVSLFFF